MNNQCYFSKFFFYLSLCLLFSHRSYAQWNQNVQLLFVGDAMQHEPQYKAAQRSTPTTFYKNSYRYIQSKIRQADIAAVNFETTIGTSDYSGYPLFSSPSHFAEGLKQAGFNLFITSNNHILDKGVKGVELTLSHLDSLGVNTIGTYRTPKERAQRYPLLQITKGIKIGFLSYTYGMNGHSPTTPQSVNIIDTTLIRADLKSLLELNPDIIIAMLHWGEEYQLKPSKTQRNLAAYLREQGVRIIIGSHPHVVQPIEIERDSSGAIRSATVYSLGNFVSNQSDPFTQITMMFKVSLSKLLNKVSIEETAVELNWVNRTHGENGRLYEIIPSNIVEQPESMSEFEWSKMQHELKQLREKKIFEY